MPTQYIRDDVLVRPFEVAATNFLSSRYYNGRGIVDLLETPATAEHWMQILSAEIGFPRTPFLPTDDQLARLTSLREIIEVVYRGAVDGSGNEAASALTQVLFELSITPALVAGDAGLEAIWTARPEASF